MENQQEKEFSAEELAQQKENMLKFYTESLPYLEAQYQYEDLLLRIDEARFKRTNIQMQYAMMAQAQQEAELEDAQQKEEQMESKEEIANQKRKLRKE
jgi:hypothetical protein